MAKKIKVDLYIDGAPKFKSDIRDINASLKQLQSELKVNSEEFKTSQNSAEALSQKSEILAKQYETASEKVRIYAERLDQLRGKRDAEKAKLDEYRNSLEKENEKLKEIGQTSGETSKEYQKQQDVVTKLEKDITKMEGSVAKLDKEEVQLQTSMNNATAEQIKYEHELNETNGYLKEAESSTDKLATSINEYGKKASEGDEATEKLSESLNQIKDNAAFEKLAEESRKLLETMIECAEVAERYEYAIAKVQSIAKVSGEELNNMSDEIRNVAVEMGYSANDVAEATYQAISASVDTSEAIGFVSDATKLARAGFTELTTAVDVETTALNAYGKEANTTAHIADDLITTQNLGKTTVDELAQSIGTIIPTAAAYGVSLDQLSTAYTLLTKQGINTAYSTTYLRGMFNELGDAGSDVSEILQDLTGRTFGQLVKEGYTLGDVMQILGDYVHGDSEAFANLFGNIRAGQGALALYNQGAEAFNSTLKIMQDNAGATDEAFATMADTAVMTNERFNASIENLKIAVGESLSPSIEKLKKLGIDMLEPITEFVEANPALMAVIAGMTAGLVAVTAAATAGAAAFTLLSSAMGGIPQLIGLMIGGAAAGGLLGMAAASEDATQAIAKMTDELKKSHEITKENAEKSTTNIARAKELADRYNELANKTQLSDEEFKELNATITELNSSVPGCALAYRESADAIDSSTVALQANIDAMIAEMEYSANMEELTTLYKERAEAEKAVAEASEQLKVAEEDQAYYSEQLKNGITEAATAYDIATSKVNDLTVAQKEAENVYNETNARIEELNGSVVDYQQKIQESIEANGGLTDALGVTHQSLQEVEEANKAIKQATEDANAAIRDQIGLFDEWNKTSDLTLSEMIERWEGQTSGVKQYKDDLVYLKGVIDSDTDPAIKNLASNMANLGVDGAAEIHNFVEGLKEIKDGSGDSAQKLKDLAGAWQDHIDAINDAEGIYKSIQLEEKGYVKDSEALFSKHYNDSETAQEEYNKAMTDMAGSGVQDQAKAINETAHEVEDATTNMGEGAVAAAYTSLGMPEGGGQSTIFFSIGSQISESVAKGIAEGESGIADAMKNTLQKAADAMDVSSVASKINSKISEALNSSSFVNALADKASAKINSDYNKQRNAYK